MPITSVFYYRLYKDGHAVILSTDPSWTFQFFEKGHYKRAVANRHPSLYRSGFSLGDYWGYEKKKETQDLYQDLKNFNIGHPLLMLRVEKDYMDGLRLAGNISNDYLNELYLANIEVLDKFFNYFMIKGSDIIKRAESNKIFLHDEKEFFKQDSLRLQLNSVFPDRSDPFLIKKISIKGREGEVRLTEKETDCIKLWVRGLTAKEIGHNLSLSSRTVEKNLENIRRKAACFSRSQLIQCVLNDNLAKRFILKEILEEN